MKISHCDAGVMKRNRFVVHWMHNSDVSKAGKIAGDLVGEIGKLFGCSD
jgi:hypothetical protein